MWWVVKCYPVQSVAGIKKAGNGEPPCFLGTFLESRVRPPQFLGRQAERQSRMALVSRNQNEAPSVSCKNH